MKNHTRTKAQIVSEFQQTKNFPRKIQLATEWYVAQQMKTNPDFRWRKLPSKAKYLSMIAKHWRQFGYLALANPGMEGLGGFIGVSKSKIAEHFPKKLRPGSITGKKTDTPNRIREKIRGKSLKFPLIAKPDAGEQCSGVTYLGDESQLDSYLKSAPEKFLIEAYKDLAMEFGVMVERDFNTGKFKITSLTEKRRPTITGDGQKSAENLISELSIDNIVKDRIKSQLSAQEKSNVPRNGEVVFIVRTATAYHGTQNINLKNNITPALTKHINAALENFRGFFIGRFDIRADSIESLQAGNFFIIELNGTGGIPLHIYCAENTVEENHQIMNEHFGNIFRIARANAKRLKQSPLPWWRAWWYVLTSVYSQKIPGKSADFRQVSWEILKIVWKLKKQLKN